MKVRIKITLKESVLDPQGQAIAMSLKAQGYSEINSVRQGKIIDIDMDGNSLKDSKKLIEKMCHDLLINPQIENFSIEENEQLLK